MISRNQTVDPKGLMHCFPLLDDLIKLSKTAEIHSQPIRQAFLKLLQENPNINDTKFNGSVFINLKADRIGVLLCHLRRLKIQGDMGACASKLTSAEFGLLQKLVDSVETKVSPEERAPRKLKKELSEVSQDSKGYPSCLKSPDKANILTKGKTKEASKEEAAPPSFFRGRIGQKASSAWQKQEEANEGDLAEAMGFGGKKKKTKKKKVAKKPCQKDGKVLKKPAAKPPCQKVALPTGRAPWVKLRVCNANKPVHQGQQKIEPYCGSVFQKDKEAQANHCTHQEGAGRKRFDKGRGHTAQGRHVLKFWVAPLQGLGSLAKRVLQLQVPLAKREQLQKPDPSILAKRTCCTLCRCWAPLPKGCCSYKCPLSKGASVQKPGLSTLAKRDGRD